MVDLRRIVRLTINPTGPWDRGGRNSFAGSPAMDGLGRHYEVDVTCTGDVDPQIGYLVDIKSVDQAVRTGGARVLVEACLRDPTASPATLVRPLMEAIQAGLAVRVSRVGLRLTPYHAVEMRSDQPTRVIIKQVFDFAASHRLHVASMSDEENRRAFGKCNNPAGHGHNYRVEPAIEAPAGGHGSITLGQLERLVDDEVIRPFDHKNLNVDTREFGAGGLNPTVENIAMVCYQRLAAAVATSWPECRVRHVTVWETDRTSSTYPAE